MTFWQSASNKSAPLQRAQSAPAVPSGGPAGASPSQTRVESQLVVNIDQKQGPPADASHRRHLRQRMHELEKELSPASAAKAK